MEKLIVKLADDIVRIVWSGLSQRIVNGYPEAQKTERASLLQYVVKPRLY